MSTNFTKRVLDLPQFDILTISTQTFGLLIILVSFIIKILTLDYYILSESKKFGQKKYEKQIQIYLKLDQI